MKNIAAETIRVECVGVAAINDLVKIVGHSNLPFCALAAIVPAAHSYYSKHDRAEATASG